ncbi:MAG TPA: LptF/LptG family permease, partial [Sedimentisphaerales bacterium]|nr:LptF/LptG family permease [Sedimentisphaerales bacterium]
MKILDKYVAKNFLIGYGISFCVLMGLRIVIDLFVNLDEFAEHADLGTAAVVRNIFTYYGLNSMLYFRDFAGMITVVAAAFSLGKMVRNNELVAVMASGVGLRRVIAPIIILALLLSILLVVDQEFLIPPLSDKLVRDQDDIPGRESYDLRFIRDGRGSLICSQRFDSATATLYKPVIILRKETAQTGIWEVTARISADKAVYDFESKQWNLVNGWLTAKEVQQGNEQIAVYATDLSPKDIPVRRKSEHKSLLGWGQLSELISQKTSVKDMAELISQKHFRVTEPVMNIVMLLISLPILVCRDPRAMKSAVMISFGMTTACYITNFICKLVAAEAVFGTVMPQLWAWLPIFIFLPAAFL